MYFKIQTSLLELLYIWGVKNIQALENDVTKNFVTSATADMLDALTLWEMGRLSDSQFARAVRDLYSEYEMLKESFNYLGKHLRPSLN